jgi:hypothetical protein
MIIVATDATADFELVLERRHLVVAADAAPEHLTLEEVLFGMKHAIRFTLFCIKNMRSRL